MRHTVVALVQDKPGVLNRAVSIFRRRRMNIESLAVVRTETSGVSRLTCVVTADDVRPALTQLEKLIDVLSVSTSREESPLSLAVVRACAPSSAFALAQADGVA